MPSINEQLSSAEIFIDNMQRFPAVRDAFAGVGRGEEYVQEGRQLLEEARRLCQQQLDMYGDQYDASSKLARAREAVHDQYMAHLELARVLFEEDIDAQADLVLRGERRQAFKDWVVQTRTFYEKLLSSDERLAQMATLMITREDLEAAQAQVEAVAAARSEQQGEMSEAQDATERRDEALDRLNDWVSQNRRIARVLLRKNPQHLEALGIRA